MIKLGEKVKDQFTGFEGIATARTMYLYGCTRILVEPSALGENGRPIKGEWLDEQRLDAASESVIGGPGPTPPSRDP